MTHVNAVSFTILIVLFVIVTVCGFATAMSSADKLRLLLITLRMPHK